MDHATGQATVATDEHKREPLPRNATWLALRALGIIAIRYEVSTCGMQKSLSYKARTDQYTLAMHVRPR